MDFELFTYRQIFDQTIESNQTKAINTEELQPQIDQESTRILTALLHNTAQMNPANLQQYIQQHQQAIHILLDDLDNITQSQTASNSNTKKKEIEAIFLNASEHLLTNLKKYFPAYFNYQSILPPSLTQKTKAYIEQKSSNLIQVFTERKNPKQPINNLENKLNELFTVHHHITYAQKAYLETFLDSLTGQFQKTESGIEVIDIILRIITLNYNHPAFYDFCCRYFSSEVERCEELSSQITTLNFIKKSISQTSPPIIEKYHPTLPEIQTSLLKFITAELDYLKSMDSIGAQLHQQGLLDDRYKVTLTVRQLAIFIHLQVEAGIIITESPKLLHEYIAKHYRTDETDRISAKSFKNAYYSASTADLEKVIDKMVTMLAIAQEKL